MKQILYILIVPILMSSCATIVNQPYKYVTVHTTEPSTIIYRRDTINTIDNKVHLKVERKKETLSIVAATDSLTKTIRIESRNSFMYWANILNCGTGMLVDMKNPKRYSYPDKIYINSADKIDRYYLYGKANNKGELYLHLSPPPSICLFQMTPENEGIKVHVGLEKFAVGLDYYHSKNQFIHLGVSKVVSGGDFSLKIYKSELINSDYICLSNNYKIGRFSIGYGLSYAKNTWEYEKWEWGHLFFIPVPVTVESAKKNHNAFGLIFPGYFQLGEYFYVGVVYRPTFYRPNVMDKFSYEHLISVDFAWKIRLKK